MAEQMQIFAQRLQYSESQIDRTVLWESHCHAQFELICVLEGDIGILLEGRSYRVKSGQTVILPPLLYHTITANQKGIYRRVTALFDVLDVPEVLRSHFLKKDSRLTLFFFDRASDLAALCTSSESALYEPLLQSLFIQLLYDDLRAKRSVASEVDETLQKILSYIDAHLGEKILLCDLAACAACSESTVSHLFGEKMKISPKQYILQKKLAYAEQLIRQGTPLTLAAMRVGYENYSNFYRMYRKHLQTTPSNLIRP